MKTSLQKIIMCALLGALVATSQAGPFGQGFGGAMGGAIFGSLLGGQKGARTGAVIGGSLGFIRGVSDNARRQAEQEAYQRQEAERQRIALEQQRQDLERLKAAQAAQAATPVADPTLVIEIQKSLIRMGYDPGAVDGKLGSTTIITIKEYQTKKGLLVDGNPTQALLVHMLRNGG